MLAQSDRKQDNGFSIEAASSALSNRGSTGKYSLERKTLMFKFSKISEAICSPPLEQLQEIVVKDSFSPGLSDPDWLRLCLCGEIGIFSQIDFSYFPVSKKNLGAIQEHKKDIYGVKISREVGCGENEPDHFDK